MSKSTAVLRLVEAPQSSNILAFPVRNPFATAREPAGRETVRVTLRSEVTTLELERHIER